jgi:hypothetical protein
MSSGVPGRPVGTMLPMTSMLGTLPTPAASLAMGVSMMVGGMVLIVMPGWRIRARTLWRINAVPRGATFMTELVAMANYRKPILRRASQSADGGPRRGLIAPERLTPSATLLLMTGLTRVLSLKRVIGVGAGHDATAALVQSVIDRLEP